MPAEPPPFLDDEAPPWLARLLATSVLVIAVLALAVSLVVRVPETVSGRFVLVPARGGDPLRAPKEGVVTRVVRTAPSPVRQGDTLFVVASEPAFDRGADRLALEATMADGPGARRDLLAQIEGVRRADDNERHRLDQRIATLERSVAAKREQREIAHALVDRARQSAASGLTSTTDLDRDRLEASRLDDELATVEGTLADTRAGRARLEYDALLREAEYRERLRRLDLDIAQARARLGALRATGTTGGAAGPGLVVPSPCDGTLIRLHTRSSGAYVGAGDELAEVACSGDSLVVEVDVPKSGVGRVRPGQDVRLLYDAFPYERYGVRYGEVTWVGAASAAAAISDSTAFRARARPDDVSIRVDGADRDLLAGMGGTARIVVERRRLISYAFAPLREFREAMADRRPPAPR